MLHGIKRELCKHVNKACSYYSSNVVTAIDNASFNVKNHACLLMQEVTSSNSYNNKFGQKRQRLSKSLSVLAP